MIRAATVASRDPDLSAEIYARWLDYDVVETGVLDDGLARSWGAPASAGRRYVVSQPASGRDVFLRFVERAPEPGYRPLRTFGWGAIEICVLDTKATHSRMQASPFEVIGPPRALDDMPAIFPMQVKGPDQEILYLTQIRADPDAYALPRARTAIDQIFIMVLACSDLASSIRWFRETLCIGTGFEGELTYTMLAKAFDLPVGRKHRIATGVHEMDCFLELDQYPEAATPRPGRPDELKPGVALVTLKHPDFDGVAGDWISPPVRREGPLYSGGRTGALRAPDGAIIEIVEAL